MKPPLPNSYWIEPGRLLAGEHPNGRSEQSTRERLATLLAAGVRSFVDLTEPGELPSYSQWLPAEVAYEPFPMPDHSLPHSRQQMREVQDALRRLSAAAGAVYVHCRAGIGRTGMTIGCYLREQGRDPAAALEELNQLWQQNARSARWPSTPETSEQEHYISEWMPRSLRLLDHYRGCLAGMAAADIAATAAGGSAAAGWSDETGTTLCVAESLLSRGGFESRDLVDRLRAWAQDPPAQGAAADAALRPAAREALARALWSRGLPAGSHDPELQDGSPLARSVAAALFAAGQPQLACALGEDVTRLTHQGPIPVEACRLFTNMVAAALQGQPRAAVLGTAQHLQPPPGAAVGAVVAGWAAPQAGRRKPPTGILGALDRAVRSFDRSTDFASGLERALAAPAAERDAVAAGFGALAGAFYGESSIPLELRQRIAGADRLERVAEQFFHRMDAAARHVP